MNEGRKSSALCGKNAEPVRIVRGGGSAAGQKQESGTISLPGTWQMDRRGWTGCWHQRDLLKGLEPRRRCSRPATASGSEEQQGAARQFREKGVLMEEGSPLRRSK